jgi:hypothetical protein
MEMVGSRIRRPMSSRLDDDDPRYVWLVFEPDLTTEEGTHLAALVDRLGDWYDASSGAGLDDEIAALRAYMMNATPTGAETVRALKALIRVVRSRG